MHDSDRLESNDVAAPQLRKLVIYGNGTTLTRLWFFSSARSTGAPVLPGALELDLVVLVVVYVHTS